MAACGGSDPAPTGETTDAGTNTNSATDTGAPPPPPPDKGECTVDADCAPKLPQTTPAGCAEAKCDSLQRKCHFKAKDVDGDGHLAKNCSAATITIEAGDDCDDADPNTYPGAWDGPATDVDSGAGAKPDRCEEKDNDCNGTPDDGKLQVDGGVKTCACNPDAPPPCYEYPNGVPISPSTLDQNNKPRGTCKKGAIACVNGVRGACNGAVGPEQEICDDQDHDCDGVSGNAGDTKASGKQSFCPDADNDNYCVMGSCVNACVAPANYRPQNTCLGTDCNDGVGSIHPGAFEYCGDGVDSNCAGGDNDGYSPQPGTACTAGNFGVCKRTGSYVCNATKDATQCNATAGTAVTGGKETASTDPLIDMTQARAGYDPRWDWDCNNTQEVSEIAYGSYFRSNACSGNYQAACATLTNETACNAGVFGVKFFNCEYYPPGTFYWIDPTSTQMCGRYVNYISCLWQFNGGSGCTYVPNTYTPNNHKVACK